MAPFPQPKGNVFGIQLKLADIAYQSANQQRMCPLRPEQGDCPCLPQSGYCYLSCYSPHASLRLLLNVRDLPLFRLVWFVCAHDQQRADPPRVGALCLAMFDRAGRLPGFHMTNHLPKMGRRQVSCQPIGCRMVFKRNS